MKARNARGGPAPSLAVCFIARDEEERLPEAIESVRSVAGEIIVADTGSTDGTAEVAARLGARVVHESWADDFSAARNASLRAATSDWVLCLDADERLAAGQEGALGKLLAGNADAWYVVLRSPLAGGRVYEHRFPRLFRNRPGHRFRGRVHEQIVPALRETGARVGTSALVIDHEGYAVGGAFAESKLRRNLRLLRLDEADHPDDGLVRFHLGETHALLGEPDEALRSYDGALGVGGLPPEQALAARLGIASAHLKRGRWAEAIEAAEAVLAEDANALDALLVLASAHLQTGKAERAVACVDRFFQRVGRAGRKGNALIRFEPDVARAWLFRGEALLRLGRLDEATRDASRAVGSNGSMAAGHRLGGRIALARRDYEAARESLHTAAALDPERADSWRDLALALLRAGDPAAALAAVEEGLAHVGAPSLFAAQGHLRLVAGDLSGAALSYERVLESEPDSIDALRRLAGICRKSGKNDEALRYWTRLQEIEKRDAESGQYPTDGPSRNLLAAAKVPVTTSD